MNSKRGTQFRIWATALLREYLIKGFTINDEPLKEAGNNRYFEELLARIRDLRSSEKIFWRKVLDIYATSIDYDPEAESSQIFFKQVQNKMHWAAHGHTVAEIIHQRADAGKKRMGITNFVGNKLLKRDVSVAKNYLSEDELNILNRIITAYLEMAELQALNHVQMYMKDWIEGLDMFLTMTGRELLANAGTVSNEQALQKARDEYAQYKQKYLCEPSQVEKDFIEAEKHIKRLSSKNRRK